MKIYCDGSAEPNPGTGGWAFTYKTSDHWFVRWGCEEWTTNNRMEMMAVCMAIDYCGDQYDDITIYSDSTYVVNGMNSWMYSWEKKGWKKKGGEIKNLDLWKELFAMRKQYPHIKMEWVRGHSGVEGNELADKYASNAGFHQYSGKKEIPFSVVAENSVIYKKALIGAL